MVNNNEIGQIKKYFKFPLSNNVFQVPNYVLSYIKEEYYQWIQIN